METIVLIFFVPKCVSPNLHRYSRLGKDSGTLGNFNSLLASPKESLEL